MLPANTPVIRAMPNTPSQVMEGMTAVAAGTHATSAHLDLAHHIFGSVGRCITLAERHFDAVTALSASGPAFIYIVIEALAEGGVKSGLPRDVSTELAAQMTLGAAKMVIQTGQHPAILKDHVTTPGGCTIDGILKLEEGGLRVTLIKAVTEATKRASELG
jgi:pyrroline-5-carboxylate reductase